jgi:hypothetical protein
MGENFDSRGEAQKIERLALPVHDDIHRYPDRKVSECVDAKALCQEMALIWGDPDKFAQTISALEKDNSEDVWVRSTSAKNSPMDITSLEFVNGPNIWLSLDLGTNFTVTRVGNKIEASRKAYSNGDDNWYPGKQTIMASQDIFTATPQLESHHGNGALLGSKLRTK